MNRQLFGTDGVRGLAGEYPLDDKGSTQIGRAVAKLFAKPGQLVVIGCDTRESSAQLVSNVAAGLNASGVNAVLAGVISTPGLAYLTREHDEFVAGIMITASHNPYQYNGIKVFSSSGEKLSDDIEAKLNSLIESELEAADEVGSQSEATELLAQYEDFLVNSLSDVSLADFSIAIDSANGSTSSYAARVFERLGAKVTALSNQPDGRNINADCGATHPSDLAQAVTRHKLDLGLALDGDADRLIMVDEQGREVRGDHIMYILAVDQELEGVVATVMSNVGFEQALKDKGIDLIRAKVGDRYVLEELENTGYKLGGEDSGHIVLPDILKTGDGILAAIQTLGAVKNSGKSLAAWRDEIQLLPQALVNIDLPDKALLSHRAVDSYIQDQNRQMAGKGRLLIRPSGTEPLARVMVEADNAQLVANRIAAELKELLNQAEQ